MENLMKKLKEAQAYIEKQTKGMPIEVGLVLGSGLGDMAQEIKNPVMISYRDIPNFPVSTVPGHAGRMVIGELQGKNVLCMQGRFHFYEGYGMDQVVFPIQVMRMLGIEYLILTNAAGCVNVNWEPGTLMMITDHIKLAPESPTRGPNEEELGSRFFDMSSQRSDIIKITMNRITISLKIKSQTGNLQCQQYAAYDGCHNKTTHCKFNLAKFHFFIPQNITAVNTKSSPRTARDD